MNQPINDISEITYSVEMLEKKPPRFISIFIILLIVLIGSAFVWLACSKMDITTQGTATIDTDQFSVPIVSEMTGTIKKTNIQDGMQVNKGHILLELDKQAADSKELMFNKQKIKEGEKKKTSFAAVYTAVDSGNYSATTDLTSSAKDFLEAYQAQVNQIQLDFSQQDQENKSALSSIKLENEKQILAIEAEKVKLQEQIEIWNGQKEKMDKNQDELVVLDEQIQVNQILIKQLDKQIGTLQQTKTASAADFDEKENNIAKSLSQSLNQLQDNTKLELQEKLIEIDKEIIDLKHQQSLMEDRLDKYIIKSPISGTVQTERNWNGNQSVQEGQSLFTIFKNNKSTQQDVLLFIDNRDIRKLDKNQPVRIHFPSDSTNGTDVIKGKITYISKEPIMDEEKQIFSYYARAVIDPSQALPNKLQGKAVVVTNQVSSLKYFLSKLNMSNLE